MTYILSYVTVPDAQVAENILRRLLEKRFVACGNILPGMSAMYWWEGKIETAQEVAMILKTREDLFEDMRGEILKHHPYDCPAIVAMPITQAHRPFLKFIEVETDELSRRGE